MVNLVHTLGHKNFEHRLIQGPVTFREIQSILYGNQLPSETFLDESPSLPLTRKEKQHIYHICRSINKRIEKHLGHKKFLLVEKATVRINPIYEIIG